MSLELSQTTLQRRAFLPVLGFWTRLGILFFFFFICDYITTVKAVAAAYRVSADRFCLTLAYMFEVVHIYSGYGRM